MRLQTERRGVVIPLVVVMLPVVLMLVGFAINLTLMQKSRSELRMATDVAARAAALELARTGSQPAAIAAAQRVAANNSVASQGLSLAPSDIVFGRINEDALGRYQFNPASAIAAGAGTTPPNAVRINGRRSAGSIDGPINLIFGGLLGTDQFTPETTAVAGYNLVDVCLVLDRSTSMKTIIRTTIDSIGQEDDTFCLPPSPFSRFQALVDALMIFTDQLRNRGGGARVAVISYASDIDAASSFASCGPPEGYYTFSATTLDVAFTESMDAVDSAVDTLRRSLWNGKTEIESGLRRALNHVRAERRAGVQPIIIVMTDGRQTSGDVTIAARECAAEGVIVHTITFGDGALQEPMRRAAADGNGAHYHAPDEATLREVFRELASLDIRLTE